MNRKIKSQIIDVEFGVIIATSMKRNRMLLDRSLNSVLNQTFSPDFIVVVDDNNDSDNFELLTTQISQLKNEKISLIKNAYTKQMSGTGAWNSGFDYLKEKFRNINNAYIAILDDDDEWLPNYLQNCYKSILTRGIENTQAIFPKLRRIHSDFSLDMNLSYSNLTVNEFLVGNPGVQGSNMVFRCTAFENAGRFDESLCSCTDRDLMIRFLQQENSNSIEIIQELSVYHYADSTQTVTNLEENKHKGLDRFYEKYIDIYSFELLHQSLIRAEKYFNYTSRPRIEKLYRQKKTILVTGVCGFIGSYLAAHLVNLGYVVYGVDNLSSGSLNRIDKLLKQNDFHFVNCDLSVEGQLTNIFSNVSYDFVFHLAALPRVNYSFDYPVESFKANVTATINLANAIKANKVTRFIFSSSSSVYGTQMPCLMNEDLSLNPLSPYARQKAEAEQQIDAILSKSETDCIILRLFNVYGYDSLYINPYPTLIHKWMVEMTSHKTPVILGGGGQSRDFTYIDDVIVALKSCIESYRKQNNPTIINIGCSESITINEVYEKLSTQLQYNKPPLHKNLVYPEPAFTKANSQKAADILNWKPQVTFDEGVKKTVSMFKERQKIVIGMPLHNGAATIRRAVSSLINQKKTKREICLVIVNDSSTDNWHSEISDLINESFFIENVNFKSVHITRNYINQYILNRFPDACLIGRLDADDELAHDNVLCEVEKIMDTQSPDIILAGNLLRCNDTIIERKNCPMSDILDHNNLLKRLKLMAEGASHAELPSCNTLMKPHAILDYPNKTSAEDHWLTVEYILNKHKFHIHVAEELIYAVYSLSGNLSANNKRKEDYFKSRLELYDYALAKIHGDGQSEN